MDLYGHHKSAANEKEATDDSAQQRPKWHVYLEAAVRRQHLLVSLNERLARFLRIVHDVEFRGQRQLCVRTQNAAIEDSYSGNDGFSGRKPDDQPEEALASNSLCQNSFEIEELEAAIQEKTRSFRSSLSMYDIRIDTLRRAMNSLNEKNEELMQENADLRFSTSEFNFELQQLRDENEKLRRRPRQVLLINQTAHPAAHPSSQQNLINSLKQENQKLRSRLERHKQTVRNNLNDFISRSMDALQNGIPMESSYEKVLTQDSVDELDYSVAKSGRHIATARWNLTLRDQVNQLRESLQSLTDEFEHEKFRFQRKIKVMQEVTDRLKENLTRKENELHRTNRELEVALGALQALIQTGDDSQKELDVYRHLLDREESRMSNVINDVPIDFDPASKVSSRSWEDSEDVDSEATLVPDTAEADDFETKSSHSLEIGKHDVRRGKYVVLENRGDEPLDISRWYLVQQCGGNKVAHRFPSPFTIKPRSKVIVWSADAKTTHESPTNYLMANTIFPWCESGEVDLVTKVYDRLGHQISKRETRIHLRHPVALATQKMLQDPKSFAQQLDPNICSIS